MARTNFDQLLQAGCHFGHLKRKWNPAMAPYIYTERNGIHIIDLHKTVVKIDEAADALKQIAKSGKKILFVATKKQTKEIIAEKAQSVGMPYVIERWPGGMLTNFPTIRKAVKKMANIDKLMQDGTYSNLSKRELLQVTRQRAKLEKNLGSIADLTRLPSALFVVDVMKEQIAVKEANRLGIPVFGIVDTNSDPKNIDFVIPANDDAKDSVEAILTACCDAINEAGIPAEKVKKLYEGRPNILDLITNGEIDLIINSPIGKASVHDDSYIRKAAIRAKVPYITTMAAAKATALGIKAIKNGEISELKSLQELHASIH